MAEKNQAEQIVEKVISQVLDSHLPQMREDLVRRVLEEVQGQLGSASGRGGSGAADLLNAVNSIHGGSTQKEILRSLLDSTSGYSGRAALFIMKSGAATGWQGRGFDGHADIKDFGLDVSSGAAAKALQSRQGVTASGSEVDSKFIAQVGAPAADEVVLLPLFLKDKVAALVYADAGSEKGGKMDAAALELLVTATSAWLEVASLRKQAAKEGTAESAGEKHEAPPAVQTVTAFSDPFAAHAPKHVAVPVQEEEPAAAAATAETVVVPQAVAAEAAVVDVIAPTAMAAAAAAAPAADPFAQMSVEDAEVHRKAQRFARLLMDEIKLYNQAKVAEGRKHKDLYDRLKEDIDKSRSTYHKRYGNTAAANAEYLTNELIRSLAEDDVSLLGANFKR